MFPFTPTAPAAAGIEVDPSNARRRQQRGALLVDVREDVEWASGYAAGAQPGVTIPCPTSS